MLSWTQLHAFITYALLISLNSHSTTDSSAFFLQFFSLLDIPQIMCYDHFYQNKTTIPITSEIELIILILVLSTILVIL